MSTTPHTTTALPQPILDLIEEMHDDLKGALRACGVKIEIGPRGTEIGVKGGNDTVDVETAYWAGWYDGREALREQRRAES